MSTDQVEEDLKKVVNDCDRIIEILNQRNTGDTFTDTSNRSWPYIKLNGHDVTRISDILKGCATIISNIKRFSYSLKEPYITISQDALNFHANAFQFIMQIEQGQVFDSDQGQIWNFVNQLKNKALEFQRNYTTYKSYNTNVGNGYAKIQSTSSGGIHWGKLNILVTICGILIAIVAGVLIANYYYNLDTEQTESQINIENIFIGSMILSEPDSRNIELENLNLPEEDKVNLFVRETRMPVSESGLQRLMLEFGTQTNPKGGDIGVTFDTKYTLVKEAFAKPFQNNFPEEGQVFIKTGLTRQESPIFETQFSHPQITSGQSYYLYFESIDPLGYIDGFFDEYNP